ncbi:cytochrome c biogenesis protein CcsA [Desulfonatronovibrio hydrogenovorans]|uniref:cytochrome c biogenesis protein CcsA n=1 Tax=Desulfonatronovibrio hydrogenovorans TaxID=53245 RepID=UPI000691CE4E|nr:cytochrome c biogenesis protein CcsA [Desulfonatronovibrio hydrogenovorans]
MLNRSLTQEIIPILAVAAGLGLVGAQYFIWVYAPVEATMGLLQKIFYFHLPLAWWGLLCFFLVFCASAGFLITRNPSFDRLALAGAELGLLYATLALVTGSIWARAAWNTWWTWDPRLSTTLVMWFIYAGYLVLRKSMDNPGKMRAVSAVLGIVAFLNVPLVFLSARMWRSIHPAVFGSRGGGLEPEMMTTVLVCITAWGLLTLTFILYRFRQLEIRDRIRNLFIY